MMYNYDVELGRNPSADRPDVPLSGDVSFFVPKPGFNAPSFMTVKLVLSNRGNGACFSGASEVSIPIDAELFGEAALAGTREGISRKYKLLVNNSHAPDREKVAAEFEIVLRFRVL